MVWLVSWYVVWFNWLIGYLFCWYIGWLIGSISWLVISFIGRFVNFTNISIIWLCFSLATLAATEEVFLVTDTYEVRQVASRNSFSVSEKRRRWKRSCFPEDFVGPRARKVSRDFLVNWASTHSLWMEIRDLLNSKMNGSPKKRQNNTFPSKVDKYPASIWENCDCNYFQRLLR